MDLIGCVVNGIISGIGSNDIESSLLRNGVGVATNFAQDKIHVFLLDLANSDTNENKK